MIRQENSVETAIYSRSEPFAPAAPSSIGIQLFLFAKAFLHFNPPRSAFPTASDCLRRKAGAGLLPGSL